MSGIRAGLQELLGKKIFRHAVEMDSTLLVRGAVTLKYGADLSPYDTGWINCSDWSNRHLGSNTTLNMDSNVTHPFNAPLPNLLVKLFYSTDGTDANSREIVLAEDYVNVTGVNYYFGAVPFAVDNNNIKIQTGANGIGTLDDSGVLITIDTENAYYKAKVYFLG